MRTLIVIAVIFLVAPWVRSRVTPERILATHWPGGNPRTYVTSVLDASGRFVREGHYVSYYENGTKACEGRYSRNVREGLWRWWYDTGEPLGRCFYRHDEGIMTNWSKDGTLLQQGPVRVEVRDGEWTEYYPSGRKRLVGTFRNGVKHGTWTFYTDEDPPRVLPSEWKNGRRVR